MNAPRDLRTFAPALLTAIIASALTACGAPTAPDGPNGGKNTLTVDRNGELEDFDAIDLRLTASSTETLTLTVSGSVDPEKYAADDEYTIHLDVVLSRAELAALSLPATLSVGGTARFEPDQTSGLGRRIIYSKEPAAAPAITSAAAAMSCFCLLDGPGSQHVTGTITIQKATDIQLYGSLDIDVNGFVPPQANTVIHVDSAFDLDLAAAATSGLTAN